MVNICETWYWTECEEKSCCESYKFRMLILLFTALIFLAAVLTTVVWMLFEMRPARRTRLRKHDETDDKIARQSFEETKYLRRYSELNPQATRRHSFNEEED